MRTNKFLMAFFAFVLFAFVPTKPSAYMVKYKEDYYKLFHVHYQQFPDDCMENIYWLEKAVQADFANPLYAEAKIETEKDPEYFADIVQVNSKSGLRGSKANFAYAGGKFGGIGLTQSFALELAPFRVKVNSICPGNFYDGPLWSNPENGLFVQYLAAGKVPGAKTVQDVKDFYLAQVPMRKGCNPVDVTKAILYAIEQTGETGQAIPVTGGQVMLA